MIENNGITKENCFGKLARKGLTEESMFTIRMFFSNSAMYIVFTFFLVLILYRSIADLERNLIALFICILFEFLLINLSILSYRYVS